MNTLLIGLVSLAQSLQRQINIDLHISKDSITISWYEKSLDEVIDFQPFYWDNEFEKIKSIQQAINYLTHCATTDLLEKTEKAVA